MLLPFVRPPHENHRLGVLDWGVIAKLEIHETYVNPPRLYRTTEDGQREYFSDEEAATTLAASEGKVKKWCN